MLAAKRLSGTVTATKTTYTIMNKQLLLLAWLCLFLPSSHAQELIYKTFKDTRIINTHSIETLGARKLDFRVAHRFGDLLGDNGGWNNFFGFENAADISIGFEYGLSDRLMMGISRAKGAADRKQLVNTLIKYRLVRQMTEGAPLSLTILGGSSLTTMPRVENSGGINAFPKFSHRLAFVGQMLLAKKFSNRFTLQLSTTFIHRNLVRDEEDNDTFAAGMAGRWQFNKTTALLFDFQLPLNGYASPFGESNPPHYPSLGFGLEFDTGGHVFQINLTNSRGIMETDFIPNTTDNWLEGQFRLGFTISRLFNL